MAATKTRNRGSQGSSKRASGGSSAKRRPSSSSSGTKRRTGSSSRSKKATQSRSKRTTKSPNRSRNGAGGRSKERSRVARVAAKAKAPALAGGAALVGFAGGTVLARNQRHNGLRGRASKLTSKVPKPNMPSVPKQMRRPENAARAVGSVAGEVARRSGRIGQIASEVQKASDAIADRSGSTR